MPKEMLPIVDKPILQYIVEEVVAAGIEDIIFVTSWNKRACEDHFDLAPELESWLEKQKKKDVLKEIRRVARLAHFIYIRQKGRYGNGTPVLNAEQVIGKEPFAVVWGDDLFHCPRIPRLKQLIEVFYRYGDPVLTGYKIKRKDTEKYGIIDGIEVEKGVYQVKRIVEKPGAKNAPSLIASLGGYVLTPDIFQELKRTPPGKGGELWLVDALFRLSKKRPLYATIVDGVYYDVGSKLGWLKANVDFALRHKGLGKEFKKYIKNM